MNTNQKKPIYKKVWFWIVAVIIIGIIGISNSQNNTNNIKHRQSSETNKSDSIPTIYAENESINKFLVKYNEINPTDKITSNQFKEYYHHGRVHKDQIIFEDKKGFEIVITDQHYSSKRPVKIVISNTNPNTKTIDEYKMEFIKFSKTIRQQNRRGKLEKNHYRYNT